MTNFLTAKWENLVMANYAIAPQILLPYLPKGTELDYFEGKTYVSLVGFLFKNTKIFGLPALGLSNFEEVNLRFYITRKEGNIIKRGVVFINETIPYKIVAWVANWLYKEHYTAVPTKHKFNLNAGNKAVNYFWKKNKNWSHIKVLANLAPIKMAEGSFESFIFEHYFGYTKVSEKQTLEYYINHPQWQINQIVESDICCDFKAIYGQDFAFLSEKKPDSVMMAEGSAISVRWKRTMLSL